MNRALPQFPRSWSPRPGPGPDGISRRDLVRVCTMAAAAIGIAHVPNTNLRLRDEWSHIDARRSFTIDLTSLWDAAPPALAHQCTCGDIMAGISSPDKCPLFGVDCIPESPVGACMVSSEGTCRIWHTYGGGRPDLSVSAGATCGVLR